MKRGALIALLAAVLAAPASAVAPRPRLTLVKIDPVVVAGAHFRPLGVVKVTIYVDPTVTLSAKASRAGTFRLAFARVALGPCGGSAHVQAIGARGQVAALAIPRASCMTR